MTQVTDAQPAYSGQFFITSKIHPTNPFYPKMEAMGGQGAMIIMGDGKHMFNGRQGDGHYRIDIGLKGPEEFANNAINHSDFDAAKKFLLQEQHFGSYAPQFRDIIQQSEGPFRPWLMYYMPTDRLNWKPARDVTLIGDGAHVTTPFVGDGVNCAMRDSCILAEKIKELGVTQEAIAAYEKETFPYAIDVITRSLQSGKMFFADDGPKEFLHVMTSGNPLIGASDGS